MKTQETDIVIVGGGPVGLMCAYLGHLSGLKSIVIEKSAEPLQVGRADALNARTLQLLEVAGLFDELYPQGKPCNTSSVWANGKFVSRQSAWWDELQGCMHKHFLMLGQSFVEQLLDKKLREAESEVRRLTEVKDIQTSEKGCTTTLANGDTIQSRFVIGADGSRSLVRELSQIPFEIVRPQLVWAVIDAVIETDFEKVPEIIVFQAETSDVAWIPREGKIDRFYVRMDTTDFELDQALAKINRAMHPQSVSIQELVWFSKFSVKESVAEHFSVQDRVFLAGDACHIHSVNGGQGLNTGLADAFNLMWKLNMAVNFAAGSEILRSYESERKPVAMSVVKTSGELVRSTKYSDSGTHAQDYVQLVQRHAGNVTGMGIRYGQEGLVGTRVHDFVVHDGSEETRLYSLLDYSKYTLLVLGDAPVNLKVPTHVQMIQIHSERQPEGYWAEIQPYGKQMILVRPDAYIQAIATDEIESLLKAL